MRLPYFLLIGLILVSALFVTMPYLVMAYGDHKEGMSAKYIEHPTSKWFYERHEIHLMEVWIQPEQVYDPWNAKCHRDYTLTPDGRCTLTEYHYWVYSLYLISEMPSACDNRAVGCIVENGIYILNGHQGNRPSDGGCTVLWHEIVHLIWVASTPVEDHHDRMELEYPNERCSPRK